jgi:hypothetical protein
MKAKFNFNGFENQLVIVPENDNERVLTEEFLQLKPVGSKYVLQVKNPCQKGFDNHKIEITKKQFISIKFIKNQKYRRVPVFGNMKLFLHKISDGYELLFGNGTYLYGTIKTDNIFDFNISYYINYKNHSGKLEILNKNLIVVYVAVLTGRKISTLQDWYNK